MNITESEDQAQRLIFDWARWQQGKYPQLKAMYHAANEGKRSARAGAELKRQGMKPGVSDICLPYASGKYNNLYVELKVGNNKAADNQLKFVDMINSIGGKAVVVYGSEAAIELIGWEKSDTSPFFYMKFHEWGTTMHKPKKFMLEAARPTYRALKSIAEEEYEKVLKEKLGG